MYRIVLYLCFVLTSCINARAQTAEDSVKAVVNKLFDGMRNADASALREVFADSMVLQTIAKNREGKVIIRNQNSASFVDFVSKLEKGVADEQIEFDIIRVDGALASVWTPYSFYLNKKFSHCGVNSFQLVRFNDGWKIQYLIDTRKTEGCLN